jgi:hypothetical protein
LYRGPGGVDCVLCRPVYGGDRTFESPLLMLPRGMPV